MHLVMWCDSPCGTIHDKTVPYLSMERAEDTRIRPEEKPRLRQTSGQTLTLEPALLCL